MSVEDRRHIPQQSNNRARARSALPPEVGKDVWFPAVYYPPSQQTIVQALEPKSGIRRDFDREWRLPLPPESIGAKVKKLPDGRILVYPPIPEEDVVI